MIKKKTFILLSVGLLLSGCVLGGNKQKAEEGGTKTSRDKQEQTVKGSLGDLLGKASGQKCSWSYDEEGIESSGTVYVGKDKMYGEMESRMQAGEEVVTMEMKMINDGEAFYQWSEDTKQGTKMTIAEMEKMQEEGTNEASPETQAKIESMQKEYEYSCSNWKIDNSKFEVPGDVEFVDMSAVMEDTEQMQQDICGVCEQLPEGEARQQCLESCQ